MAEEKYIWCRNCDEIHHVNPFDKAPAYIGVLGEEREISMDDWREFMQRHAGHRLEGLRAGGQRYFPSTSPADPMSQGYVEVTNGEEWFVVRSFRKGIDHALNFELIRGRLRAIEVTVGIRENEIRKEMKYHFSWLPLEKPEDGKIELFIRILSDVVKGLNPYDVKVSGYDDRDSSVAYGVLEPHIVEALMEKCLTYFSREELMGLRRFIEANRGCEDVMALLIKQHYRVEESRG